jgi:hypothetical protein
MRRIAVALSAAVIVLAVAGCLDVPTSPKAALGTAAKVSAAIAHATQAALGHWCPQAFHDNGRHLTHDEAVGCLTRAKDSYLGILSQAGFNPKQIVDGK